MARAWRPSTRTTTSPDALTRLQSATTISAVEDRSSTCATHSSEPACHRLGADPGRSHTRSNENGTLAACCSASPSDRAPAAHTATDWNSASSSGGGTRYEPRSAHDRSAPRPSAVTLDRPSADARPARISRNVSPYGSPAAA